MTSSEPNLVISEYDLPSFSGMQALQIVKDEYPDLPFIFFSNTSEDDRTVSSMLEGASDFIPKKRPGRLGPAVVRELKNAEKHKKALKLHRKSQNKYERLIQSLNSVIWEADPDSFQFSYISPKVVEILGYKPQQWYADNSFWQDRIHPDDREKIVKKCVRETQKGNDHVLEYRLIDADDNIVWIKDIISVITQNGKPVSLRGLMIDETDQKIAERERDHANLQLKERIKEQKCLNEISKLDELNLTVPQLLQKTVEIIPRGFQFAKYCGAQISYRGQTAETDNFSSLKWKLTESVSQNSAHELHITAAYPLSMPGKTEPSFLEAEHDLLKSIANQLALKIDRISSRKELRKRQFLIDRAYQIAKIGSWEFDLTDKSLYWSKETRRIHEVPLSYQPTPDSILDFCKTDQDREKFRAAIQRLITVGEPFDIEFEIITEQGNSCWVRVIGESEFQTGRCVRVYGSIQDIDDQKRTQETLLHNEQRFKSMVQDGADLIAIVSSDGTYKYVSPTYQHILHLNTDKLLEVNAYNLVHPNDREKIKGTVEKLGQNDRAKLTPYRFRNGNGSWRWMESTITNLTENPAVQGLVVNSRDITEQIDREETLLEIVERYNYVTQASNDTIYDWDVVNDIMLWDQNFSKLYRTDVDGRNATIKDLYDYVHPEDADYLSKEIDDVLASDETTWEGEYRLEMRDGGHAHIYERGFIIRDKNKKAVRMIGSLLNMTDRIEYETKLKSTKKKLKDIVEHSINMFYKHDVNHKLTYVSPQSNQFLGLSPDEAKVKWTKLVTDHPINQEGMKHTQRAIDTGEAQPPFELELQKADGEKIFVRVIEAPIVEDGETVAIVGSLTDITDQKQYEKKLESLSLIASKTTDIISTTDKDYRITWVNNAFEKITGYSADESVGKSPVELLLGQGTDSESIMQINKAIENREPAEVIVLLYPKDGAPFWLDITIDPIFDDQHNCIGFINIKKDVTKQIEREKKLQDSVERYDIVAKATSETIWDLDPESGTITYNKNIETTFGYNDNTITDIDKWHKQVIHPEDFAPLQRKMSYALKNGEERLQFSYRMYASDGSVRHIYDRAFIVKNNKGKPVRVIGAMQDVTRQKQEENWLKLLESAIGTTEESIVITEADPTDKPGRKIEYVNSAFTKMTGYSKEEVIGETLNILNGPNTEKEAREHLKSSMEKYKPCNAEFINYKKSGEEFWILVSMAPVVDVDGNYTHWVCVGRDITDKIEHENMLRESLKEKETLLMEVHHRVKNNMAVVSGIVQLQAFEEEDVYFQKKLFDSVSRIKTMAVVHELLYQSKSFSSLDFSENLKKLVSVITDTLNEETTLNLEFNCENLTLNVNQAIPCSLIVNEIITNSIKHAYNGVDEGTIRIDLTEQNNRLILIIDDDGSGLKEAVDSKKIDSTSSLGIHLIDTLSSQLEADYEYKPVEGGTRFRLEFEISELKGTGNAHL